MMPTAKRRFLSTWLAAACLALLAICTTLAQGSKDYFVIRVVDEETGRGVPMVELKTTGDTRYYTDSAGIVAFYEPGLMGRDVFFHVKSHGYEFPADYFGYHGLQMHVTPGDRQTVKLKRQNIAERLYRITGEGIYRDSVLAGIPVPIKNAVIDGLVTGQDSVIAIPYRRKIYWFWGDTMRPSYPLGHFGTAGATSELQRNGGLDPAVGIDLTYFVDDSGFSRPMCTWTNEGLKWISGVMTLRDAGGSERLLGMFSRHKNLNEVYDQGLLVFNDEKMRFDPICWLPLDTHLMPDGEPFELSENNQNYMYFDGRYPTPCYRVKAQFECATNLANYESYTYLEQGAKYQKGRSRLDRGPDGKLRYGWKRGTAIPTPKQEADLISSGSLKPREGMFHEIDVENGHPVRPLGNVTWNGYLHRWVLIGWANLTDVYYAEADTPVGPWVYARKVVTHEHYSFYNPRHHPFFDQDGGRKIYFEGTYADTFSNPPFPTPRYNYNQMMYRLELGDSRIFLPSPVYQLRGRDGAVHYAMRAEVAAASKWSEVEAIPFFAMEPSRHLDGMIPVYEGARSRLTTEQAQAAGKSGDQTPCFYALPAGDTGNAESLLKKLGFGSQSIVALIEEHRNSDDLYRYAPTAEDRTRRTSRSTKPICRVWENPMSDLVLDVGAQPASSK
jgi:hypothetical protein